MNGFLLSGIAIIGFIRIVNSLFNDKQPVKLDGKPQYIINGIVSTVLPITKSYQILGIENDTLINPNIINMAFSKQLEYASEDRMLEYKVKHSLKDLKVAKQYLIDYYDYVAYLN